MGLLESIMGSMSDPNEKTGGGLLEALQGLGGQQGAGPMDMQAVIAALGKHVKSGLREIDQSPTPETAPEVANELASRDQAPPEMISKVFGSQSPAAVANDVSQKTGVGVDKIMALLPVVLPIVMKLLQSRGGHAAGQAGATAGGGGLLQGFLDSDNDGDVDLQDMLRLAAKFNR